MSEPCELCGEFSATTGVQEVKLCQACFDAIAAGNAGDLFTRFTQLAESRAPAAQEWAQQRVKLNEEAERIREQQRGTPASDQTANLGKTVRKTLAEGISAGVFGGGFGGMAAHYLAGGKMTLPIFLVISILIFSRLKGWGKLIGLVVFAVVAALTVILLQYLKV